MFNIIQKFLDKRPTEHNLGFRIIPLGTYCLPRVISTLSMLKPRKASGEKTLPFDLGFFWDIDGIIDTLDNEFKTFYDDIELGHLNHDKTRDLEVLFDFNPNAKHWVSEKLTAVFNHEYMMTDINEFKNRYDKRIENFYEYIKDEKYELYFLIASFSELKQSQITRLKNIINRYRSKNSYSIIVINQCSHTYKINDKNVYIINETDEKFDKMLRANNTNWADALKRKDAFPDAKNFYNDVTDNLKKIILKI